MSGLTSSSRPVAYRFLQLVRTVSTKIARGGAERGGDDATDPLVHAAPEHTPVKQYNTLSVLARLPKHDVATNRFLFLWMFRFLMPVKAIVFFACLWLT